MMDTGRVSIILNVISSKRVKCTFLTEYFYFYVLDYTFFEVENLSNFHLPSTENSLVPCLAHTPHLSSWISEHSQQ